MRTIILVCSCLALIVSLIMVILQIKEKKPITDPFMILLIITFIISLRMIVWMLGF